MTELIAQNFPYPMNVITGFPGIFDLSFSADDLNFSSSEEEENLDAR